MVDLQEREPQVALVERQAHERAHMLPHGRLEEFGLGGIVRHEFEERFHRPFKFRSRIHEVELGRAGSLRGAPHFASNLMTLLLVQARQKRLETAAEHYARVGR